MTMATNAGPDAETAMRDMSGSTQHYVCGRCGRHVTDRSARRSVAGTHVHTRMNPAGVIFVFGCFTRAPGVEAWSQPTVQHTWFERQPWSVTCCRDCGQHLGWHFAGRDDFHALVLERLRATEGASRP